MWVAGILATILLGYTLTQDYFLNYLSRLCPGLAATGTGLQNAHLWLFRTLMITSNYRNVIYTHRNMCMSTQQILVPLVNLFSYSKFYCCHIQHTQFFASGFFSFLKKCIRNRTKERERQSRGSSHLMVDCRFSRSAMWGPSLDLTVVCPHLSRLPSLSVVALWSLGAASLHVGSVLGSTLQISFS